MAAKILGTFKVLFEILFRVLPIPSNLLKNPLTKQILGSPVNYNEVNYIKCPNLKFYCHGRENNDKEKK